MAVRWRRGSVVVVVEEDLVGLGSMESFSKSPRFETRTIDPATEAGEIESASSYRSASMSLLPAIGSVSE